MTGITSPIGATMPGGASMEKPNWKLLSELPKLSIPSGEAWERNMVLIAWVKEVVLAATTVSVEFSDFVAKMMELAKARYEYKRKYPKTAIGKWIQFPHL